MKRIASITVSTIVLLCAVAFTAAAQEKGDFAIGLRNATCTRTENGAKCGGFAANRYRIPILGQPRLNYGGDERRKR